MPYKAQTMKRIFYTLPIVLLVACSDCECKMVNGSPNFSVRTSYSFAQNPNNIFLKDTLMAYYFVEVTEEGVTKKFTGQCDYGKTDMNGDRYIEWADGSTGGGVADNTPSALRLCLKMALWEEMQTRQGIDDIKAVLEDQRGK